MSKLKVFITTIISMIVIVLISNQLNVLFGADDDDVAVLTKDGKLTINNAFHMYSLDNVFCVEHHETLKGTINYHLIASVNIRPDSVTLKRWRDGDNFTGGEGEASKTTTISKTRSYQDAVDKGSTWTKTDGTKFLAASQKFAAIFNVKGLVDAGDSYLGEISAEQVTTWKYWNTWVSTLPADGNGEKSYWFDWRNWGDKDKNPDATYGIFKQNSGNEKLTNFQGNTADENLEKINEAVKSNSYSADIYYLTSDDNDEQRLILVEIPEEQVGKLKVTKTWTDEEAGYLPERIKVYLYQGTGDDKVEFGSKYIYASNNWKTTFSGLPVYDSNGKKITYTVGEKRSGYTATVTPSTGRQLTENSTVNITMTNKPQTTEIKVVKKWDDGNNRDVVRPDEIKIKLQQSEDNVTWQLAKDIHGNTVGDITLTADNATNANTWSVTIDDLYVWNNNKEPKRLYYRIIETLPGKYSATNPSRATPIQTNVGGTHTLTITNTHVPNLVEIPVWKIWDDDSNRDGLRPDNIKIELYADGKLVNIEPEKEVIDENTWKYVFKSTDDVKLYKYKNVDGVRTKIKYTIKEVPIENKQPYNEEQKYDAPIYQTGNGTITAGETTSGSTLSGALAGAASSEAGTIVGSNVWGATVTSGFTITNKHDPERMKLKIVKQWDDDSDLDEYRPSSIILQIYANGIPLEVDADNNAITSPIILEGKKGEFSNTWEYELGNLFRYENGKEIEYTIEELVPQGYEEPEIKTESILVDVTDDAEKEIYTSKHQITTFTITNKHQPKYEHYKVIEGKVWNDGATGKGNDINGKMDNGESGIQGVKVTLRAKDGTFFNNNNEALSTAITDENGTYRIKINYDTTQDVYKLFYEPMALEVRLAGAYVEFEYDGMKYTTVANASTGIDTSKAIEDENARNTFDSTYQTVTNGTDPNSWENSIKASTNGIINFVDYCLEKENIGSEEDTVTLKYCKGDSYLRTDPKGAWNKILESTKYMSDSGHPDHKECNGYHKMTERQVDVQVIKNVNLGLFEREQPTVGILTELSKVDVQMNSQMYTYLYNSKRTVTEEKAQQAYDEALEYAKGQGMSEEKASQYAHQIKLKAKFQNKGTYTYRRPVNPADINFIQAEENKNELKVYVTYEIELGNSSTTLQMEYHDIVVYFDADYISDPNTAIKISRGQINGNIEDSVSGYKELNITGLDMVVGPQSGEMLSITYEVGYDAIKGLLNEDETLNHAVEIVSYSTKYGANTLYAEQRTGGRNDMPYAGYDYESHPDNGEIKINNEERLEFNNPEYDTDIAPSFVLCKDNPKTLSGNVWEDSDINETDKYRLGNGKNEDESKVANVKVELYKVDDKNNLELATLYNVDPLAEEQTKPAVTYTGADGHYTFGSDTEGYSVVTDRYVIKFTYGEGIDNKEDNHSTINDASINARNYKSTIIAQGTELYNVFKGNDNEEWHLDIEKGLSVAVDDMEQRVKIEDLQYSNFNNAINMAAYSKPFMMQLEFDTENKEELITSEDGTTGHGNDLNIFDFGIIERAREDIFVQKTIEYLKITLAHGQELTSGNPADIEQNPSYMLAPGFRNSVTTGEEARNALDKWLTVQMDPELMQGATLEVDYAIKVKNNSEIDYEYYDGETEDAYNPEKVKTAYYYFGEDQGDEDIIEESVNYLVDYVDSDLTFEWKNTDKWKETSIEETSEDGVIKLRVEGQELVCENTAEVLKSGKYKAYITEQFKNLAPGEEMTDYAHATKKLTNTEDNDYENHAEILKLDAKMARTQKGKTADGEPIVKQYKMGNYVPSNAKRKINNDIAKEQAGLHEQDDDRVTIEITPPTGLLDYIMTYGLIGLGGLVVLAIGVIIIKKKVLRK